MSDFGMGQAAIDTLFCKMDTDTDGFISQQEFLKYYPEWALDCGHETKADKGIGWTEEDKQICLDTHNRLRKLHAAPPLVWCDKLAKKAKKSANICQKEQRLYHPIPAGNNAAENCTFEEADPNPRPEP